MKINTATLRRYVDIETDIGDFRVWENGAIDMWDVEEGWTYFPEFEMDDDVKPELHRQAFSMFDKEVK